MCLPLRVLDLFCGAGGLSEGFHQAGFEIVRGYDNDLKALETYNLNHDGVGQEMDLKTESFDWAQHWSVDVVIGGPPCQPFSVASIYQKVRTLDLSLIDRFMEIMHVVKPRFWLMENVPGLKKLRPGGEILNAADFGVPQARNRYFLSNFTLPESPNAGKGWRSLNAFPTVLGHDGFRRTEELHDAFKAMAFPTTTTGSGFYATQRGRKIVPDGKLIPELASIVPESLKDDYKVTPKGWLSVTNKFLAWVQGFPESYRWSGNRSEVRNQIVNAVPPPLAKAIARAISK